MRIVIIPYRGRWKYRVWRGIIPTTSEHAYATARLALDMAVLWGRLK